MPGDRVIETPRQHPTAWVSAALHERTVVKSRPSRSATSRGPGLSPSRLGQSPVPLRPDRTVTVPVPHLPPSSIICLVPTAGRTSVGTAKDLTRSAWVGHVHQDVIVIRQDSPRVDSHLALEKLLKNHVPRSLSTLRASNMMPVLVARRGQQIGR